MLTDIPMMSQIIYDQTIQRRLLATKLAFTQLDFSACRLTLRVPILHFQPRYRYQTVTAPDGQETSSALMVDEPFIDPRFNGRDGLLYYRIEVGNMHRVDVRTGKAPASPLPEAEQMYLMGEFDYLRAALNNYTLEDLLMQYLSGLVADESFDNNRYPIDTNL